MFTGMDMTINYLHIGIGLAYECFLGLDDVGVAKRPR
jgi:hypothetical protein